MSTTWLRRHPAWAHSGPSHGWTTAEGPGFRGDPAAPVHLAPVAQLCQAVGLARAAWTKQVHGGVVLYADAPGCAGEADALWSDRPGLGVVGRSADCPLILVSLGGDHECWGFAHASWRASVRGITASLVDAMADAGGDPARGTAVICPSAGPCCYEVGEEVRREALAGLGPVAGNCFQPRGDRWILDLWRLARGQLRSVGLPAEAIHVTGVCTICGTDYPSHRRQGDAAQRFAAIIGR